jgi:hypothetical protein
MIRDFNIAPDANINPSKIMGGGISGVGGGLLFPAETYYVDRNTGASGDGKSLDNAFLTITEAVAQVNEDYSAGASNGKSRGRMRRIVICEGWYDEDPIVLTAGDCHIVGNAPGAHDSVVFFCSAGGGPALTVEGWNCTIEGVGLFVDDTDFYCLQIGGHTGDWRGQKQVAGTKVLGVNFVRNGFQASKGGLYFVDMDGIWIEGCFFSTSALDAGIRAYTDGSTNPVNPTIIGCRFIGCDTGILADTTISGWTILHNVFLDDVTDRANASDNPLDITGTGIAAFNLAPHNTEAEFNAGATLHEVWNYHSELSFWT